MPSALYIFWILHQTTTSRVLYIFQYSCISFESYIKPQLWRMSGFTPSSCISFESYIKPQPGLPADMIDEVVYLLNPTSNHNLVASVPGLWVLYIFWILHQTTTTPGNRPEFSCCISFESYIKPQHRYNHPLGYLSCISFESYIKPQHLMQPQRKYIVVYLLNPTSNHNYRIPSYSAWRVVYLLNPTSNHNYFRVCEDTWGVVYLLNPTSNHNVRVTHACKFSLYIFWILHQTTTIREGYWEDIRCISFESYIKPQLRLPTSRWRNCCISFESYIKPQQTQHNQRK